MANLSAEDFQNFVEENVNRVPNRIPFKRQIPREQYDKLRAGERVALTGNSLSEAIAWNVDGTQAVLKSTVSGSPAGGTNCQGHTVTSKLTHVQEFEVYDGEWDYINRRPRVS